MGALDWSLAHARRMEFGQNPFGGQWPVTIRSIWPVGESDQWALSTGRWLTLGVWNSDKTRLAASGR